MTETSELEKVSSNGHPEEICLNHILGYSSKNGRANNPSPEYQYCPTCVPDENNKRCPYYKPTFLQIVEISENKEV